MTAPAFVTAEQLRTYMGLEADSTSRYSDGTLGSNIRAASNWLERRTNRWLWNRPGITLTLTTNGKASLQIPGLRTVTSVTRSGSTLDVDSGYWLIPDERQTGLYTALALRGTGRGDSYLANPQWFDRNLDHPYWRSGPGGSGSLPNDLVIVGDWGFLDASTTPEEVLHVTKVLAGYFTRRPDAVLSGALTTEFDGSFDLANLPVEVQAFVTAWSLRPMASAV